VSNKSAAMPAQSPTLSPTLSAIVAGLRGSSSGMAASTLPTRLSPTSAVPGNARIDLSDKVATDVRALGEDAAAEAREDRNQRCAESERDQSVDDRSVIGRLVHRPGQEAEIECHAKQRETRNQHSRDGARLESEFKPASQ